MKDVDVWTEGAQKTANRLSAKKTIPRYTVKLLKIKCKEIFF